MGVMLDELVASVGRVMGVGSACVGSFFSVVASEGGSFTLLSSLSSSLS